MDKKVDHANILRLFESSSSIIFLLVWWKYDIVIATAAIMLWLTCMALYSLVVRCPLNRLQKFIWLTSLVLGGVTVVLNNPLFMVLNNEIEKTFFIK